MLPATPIMIADVDQKKVAVAVVCAVEGHIDNFRGGRKNIAFCTTKLRLSMEVSCRTSQCSFVSHYYEVLLPN